MVSQRVYVNEQFGNGAWETLPANTVAERDEIRRRLGVSSLKGSALCNSDEIEIAFIDGDDHDEGGLVLSFLWGDEDYWAGAIEGFEYTPEFQPPAMIESFPEGTTLRVGAFMRQGDHLLVIEQVSYADEGVQVIAHYRLPTQEEKEAYEAALNNRTSYDPIDVAAAASFESGCPSPQAVVAARRALHDRRMAAVLQKLSDNARNTPGTKADLVRSAELFGLNPQRVKNLLNPSNRGLASDIELDVLERAVGLPPYSGPKAY